MKEGTIFSVFCNYLLSLVFAAIWQIKVNLIDSKATMENKQKYFLLPQPLFEPRSFLLPCHLSHHTSYCQFLVNAQHFSVHKIGLKYSAYYARYGVSRGHLRNIFLFQTSTDPTLIVQLAKGAHFQLIYYFLDIIFPGQQAFKGNHNSTLLGCFWTYHVKLFVLKCQVSFNFV